jgi:zeta-carotene desaturase
VKPDDKSRRAAKAKVAVVGGGVAGLAAACALANDGVEVTVYERKPFLGGRACSYDHPGVGQVVDNSQHILLGCCTNLREFYQRLGVEDKIRWYKSITFMEPGGRTGVIEPGWLPAPLHSGISFAKFGLLSLRDKLGIARALVALMPGVPEYTDENFLSWLKRHGQSQQAIDRFWAPVLVSSLNEELEACSVKYAGMVLRDAFLKSAEAGAMGVPAAPLSELYGAAEGYITSRGGHVHLRTAVEGMTSLTDGVLLRVNGVEEKFDYAISAVPFHQLGKVLPEGPESDALRTLAGGLKTVPITGIHLWFDRQVTELEHVALLDRNIQWVFQKSKILATKPSSAGVNGGAETPSYLELVVSSSRNMLEMGRGEVLELALKELGEFFPKVREAKLMKAAVVKEVHATFAPSPKSEAHRPGPLTAWPRIFVSGDWTNTGWPATMEGAVRAGYLTAEAVSRAMGRMMGRTTGGAGRYLVPDLKAQGLMRLFKA